MVAGDHHRHHQNGVYHDDHDDDDGHGPNDKQHRPLPLPSFLRSGPTDTDHLAPSPTAHGGEGGGGGNDCANTVFSSETETLNVGVGGLPSESQLVLLCLDYLRDLRRAYSGSELRLAEGLDADWISLGVYALSRAFVRPEQLRHFRPGAATVEEEEGDEGTAGAGANRSRDGGGIGPGNDAWFDPTSPAADIDPLPSPSPPVGRKGKHADAATAGSQQMTMLSDRIAVPTLEEMEREILYTHKPGDSAVRTLDRSSSDADPADWYSYDDTHPSNSHRFYPLNGLASSPNPNVANTSRDDSGGPGGGINKFEPLALGEIAAAGLAGLGARTRLDAERDMVRTELFQQFVEAVRAKGFFDDNTGVEDNETDIDGGGGDEEDEEEVRRAMEARRERVYEERYRKVVAKFRTKLAAKAAQREGSTPRGGAGASGIFGGGGFERSPPPPYEVGTAERVAVGGGGSVGGGGGGSVASGGEHTHASAGGGGGGGSVSQAAVSAAERQRRRRKNRIDGVRSVSSPDHHHQPQQQHHHHHRQQRQHHDHDGPDADEAGHSTSRALPMPPPPPPAPLAPSALSTSAEYNPTDLEEAERLKSTGNVFMQKKDYARAAESYTTALKLCPAGPTSHVYFSNRAAALLSMKRFEEAVVDSERSLALRPDYGKAHARLGLAQFLLGRYEEAVEAYEVALRYDPDNRASRGYLDKARKKLAAREVVENSRSSPRRSADPPSGSGREGGGLSGSSRRRRGGGADVAQGGDSDGGGGSSAGAESGGDMRSPKSGSPRQQHPPGSTRREKLREIASAFPSPEPAAPSPPQQPAAPPASSAPSHPMKDGAAAAAVVDERQRLIDQREADRLKSRGNSCMASKDYASAIEAYSAALRLSPDGPSSHVYYSNRAAALCYLERYGEAELDSQSSLALRPDYGKAHARLGLSRFFMGDYGGAVVAYTDALRLDPDNAASRSYLAKATRKLEEEAEVALNSAGGGDG